MCAGCVSSIRQTCASALASAQAALATSTPCVSSSGSNASRACAASSATSFSRCSNRLHARIVCVHMFSKGASQRLAALATRFGLPVLPQVLGRVFEFGCSCARYLHSAMFKPHRARPWALRHLAFDNTTCHAHALMHRGLQVRMLPTSVLTNVYTMESFMASLLPPLCRRLALYTMLVLALLCNKLGLIVLDMMETYVQALTALPAGRCLTAATVICLCTPAIVSSHPACSDPTLCICMCICSAIIRFSLTCLHATHSRREYAQDSSQYHTAILVSCACLDSFEI